MSNVHIADQRTRNASICDLLHDFHSEVGQTRYVEATGSSRGCRDLPVFALIAENGEATTRVFVFRKSGLECDPYYVEIVDTVEPDALCTRQISHQMSRDMANELIDRLLVSVDHGDLGECCWLHFGHNYFDAVNAFLDCGLFD